jgi:hypothetical protein
MDSVAPRLTPEEIRDVAAYDGSLSPAPRADPGVGGQGGAGAR